MANSKILLLHHPSYFRPCQSPCHSFILVSSDLLPGPLQVHLTYPLPVTGGSSNLKFFTDSSLTTGRGLGVQALYNLSGLTAAMASFITRSHSATSFSAFPLYFVIPALPLRSISNIPTLNGISNTIRTNSPLYGCLLLCL